MSRPVDISAFIQEELAARDLAAVPAVEAAHWLDEAGLLPDSSSRPGKPLRALLRDDAISGAQRQQAGSVTRWYIVRVKRSKDLDAGRKGKAVEHLVAASCILSSKGELNVSTSLVDDEGVDLVFHRRGRSATLAVQVKSRTYDESLQLQRGTFRAFVRTQTFEPRDDLYILYVALDMASATYDPVWLVPSTELAARVKPSGRGRLQFAASLAETSNDRWTPFRMRKDELPHRILSVLSGLERRN